MRSSPVAITTGGLYAVHMTIAKQPIALDICCRKGGATVGLQRAGFYVIGIDVEDQPGYPGDKFWQRDGLEILDMMTRDGYLHPGDYDLPKRIRPSLIWQSWPCQDGSTATASNRARGIADAHRQFIPRARELSNAVGIPWVIEQPTSSRAGLIRRDLTLCMDMFKGDRPPPWVQKHRSFEFGCWPGALPLQPVHPVGPVRGGSMAGFPKPAGHASRVRGHRHGGVFEGDYVAAYGDGGGKATASEIAHAMGIDWITWPEGDKKAEKAARFDLCEAIPPDYSEHIGRALIAAL